MAENIKKYSIVINGIQESVKAVDALNESLASLEKRINALQGKAVSVGSKVESGGGTKSSSKSSLSEEEKLEKQIEQIDAKRAAYSKEIYQNYLAAKDVLKETVSDQKSIAASERLQAKTYSNTIAGMKQELADIKSAMQTVDLGDTDQLDKMTQRANELNTALKKVEESYGQFGRNVGNYKDAANGFKQLNIEVNGVTRSFDNAKQALMTLKKERDTLGVGMGRTSEEFKQLDAIVKQLQSDIKDMSTSSQVMDNLLDTMQSITAIASVGQGIGAFFGLDNNKIEQSVKKLLALQNILKGIETINKQMQTQEGIGKMLSVADKAYDALTKKVLAANTAILGTGKAAQVASVGITKLAGAFKVLLKATLIMAAISIVMELFDKLIDKFQEGNKELEKQQKFIENTAASYAKAKASIDSYTQRVIAFNGSKKEEKKLVEELNKEYGDTLGTYKSLAEWKKVLIDKGDLYAQTMLKEAEAQALLNMYTEAYVNLQKVQAGIAAGDYHHWYNTKAGDMAADLKAEREALEAVDKAYDAYMKKMKEIADFKQSNKLGDFSPQIDKNGKKSADAAKKAQEDITSLQLRAMKDGLNKTLMQLDEEKRQTINKIKENGNRVGQQIKQVEEAYSQIRLNTIQEYLDKLNNAVQESAKKLSSIRFSIDTKDIELEINDIEAKIQEFTDDIVPINNTLTTKLEYDTKASHLNPDALAMATEFDAERAEAITEEQIKDYYKWLEEFVSKQNDEVKKKLSYQNVVTGELEIDYDAAEKYIEEHLKEELNIIRSYGYQENASLKSSFEFRLKALRTYNDEYISEIDKELEKEIDLKQNAADENKKRALADNKAQYDTDVKALRERKETIEKDLKAIEEAYAKSGGNITGKQKEQYDELKENLEKTNKQIKDTQKIYADKVEQIAKEHSQKLVEIERSVQEKRQQNQQRYYDKQLANYRDFLSKINSESAKQPVTDKAGFGIVNIAATKRNYKEILDATKATFENIQKDREKLNQDYKKGLIKPENYNATLNQLNDLENETKQTAQTVANNLKNINSTFVQSIQMYLQAALDSFNTIMNAVWDAQDIAFDKEQEALDKENDMLQKALDKQEEMIDKHKSEIDSIENELATSRGDRRQHIIDQLNAEMAAEREAHKQKQKIEKEQEKQQAKQDELEKKRKKAQYKRDLLQAIVNGAMAVTMAAVNSWPIPAIPMMALAGATTAAQIAIMSANKPYAQGGQLDGGVAVGNRHRDGGIKVLGGRAEIEGGEFITNRLTTSKNIDLLEFINSKKKKVDVSDLIDFYSSGTIKRNISSVKTKFEDGGYIPTLPNSIDVFDDRLIQSFENYSNRPVVVSVVDINNKQADVKRVQTLAGIS